MSFLQPWWWTLAPPAVAWVLWLHAHRHRTLQVPSIQGWEAAVGRATGPALRARPVWSWLLVLQLLAVLLAVAALAEPNVSGAAAVDEVVVIIGAGDGREAQSAVQGELRGLPSDARVTLVDARGRARPLAAGLSVSRVRDTLRDLIDDHEGPPSWTGAAALLAGMPIGDATRVVVLSPDDEQALALTVLRQALTERGGGEATSGARVPFEVRALGAGRPLAQLGTVSVQPRDELLEVHAGVVVHGQEPVALRLEAWQGDRLLAEAPLDADGPGSRRLVLPLPGLDTDPVEVRLLEAASQTPMAVAFRHPPTAAPALRVLVVGQPWPRLSATLRALGVEAVYRDDLPDRTEDYDLVLSLGIEASHRIDGHAVWWGVGAPGLLAVEPAPGPWDVLVVEHDVLMPLGMVHDFRAGQVLAMPALPGADVLVWADAHPAVQARVVDGFAEVVIAFPVDEASWLEDDAAYVLLRHVLDWIQPSAELGGPQACVVAEPCALPNRGSVAATSVVLPDGSVETAGAASTRGASAVAWRPWFVPRSMGWHVVDTVAGEARLWVDAALWPPIDAGRLTSDGVEPDPAPTGLSPARPPLRWLALVLMAAVLALAWDRLLQGGQGRTAARARRGPLLLVLAFTALAVAAWTGYLWPRGLSEPVTVLISAGLPWTVEVDGAARPSAQTMAPGGPQAAGPDGRRYAAADLAQALAWATALLVDEPEGRLHLSAQGAVADTWLGKALEEAARGARLTATLLPRFRAEEAVVPLPALALGQGGAGGTARVVVPVEVAEAGRFTIDVREDGRPWGEVEADLPAGKSVLSFDVAAVAEAPVLYELVLHADGAGEADAARTGVVVPGAGATKVAVVADGIPWALLFTQLLEVHGIEAELMLASAAPRTVAGWSGYDTVVLLDLPAIALVTSQMDALEAWVARGGGLVLLGGERSFGPGGYHLTPLDTLSPLAAEIPMDRPDVAIVFVLDRSGSMLQSVGPSTRLEIAREATWEAIQMLDPRSQVGIVVFDSASTLIHPVRPISSLDSVRRSLDLLVAGGGTALQPALEQAHFALSAVQDVRRHMVVMTDGLTQSGDFNSVMDAIVADGITVSTLAIGQGAAYPRLELIARQSGGMFHETIDFELLPSIMAQEVLLLTTDTVHRTPTSVVWSLEGSAFLDDLPTAWPEVQGAVRTTVKPAATVHATTAEGDALLASWRYGNGRVVAWTSHGAGPWTMAWLPQPDFPRLWAQAVRWAGAFADRGGPEVQARLDGDIVVVEVWVRDAEGRPEAGHTLRAAVHGPGGEASSDAAALLDDGVPAVPGGEAVPLVLREVQPGLHRGVLRPAEAGLHRLDVVVQASGHRPASLTFYAPPSVDTAGRPGHLASLLASVADPDVQVGPAAPGPTWRWAMTKAWRPYLLLALVACLAGLTALHRGRYAASSGA